MIFKMVRSYIKNCLFIILVLIIGCLVINLTSSVYNSQLKTRQSKLSTIHYKTIFAPPTSTNIPPTPVPVSFDNICLYKEKMVSIKGVLGISPWGTYCSGDWCQILLSRIEKCDSQYEKNCFVYIFIHTGTNYNQMEPLPYTYNKSDLIVHTADGIARAGDIVLVNGVVEGELNAPEESCHISVNEITIP